MVAIARERCQAVRCAYVESRAAYERFCAEQGMTPVITVADEAGCEEAGREACAALLQQHPQLDGLCAVVDAFAVGAVQGLADAGRRVPGDVRIATRYDGIRARSCRPPLTAVDLHLDEMASQAIALLFDHLAGKGGARSATPADPSLVIRESSVAAAGGA
ncbi:substrate-binding domain-containing protein [Paraburkholderia silviterrae]|uniref:substrate-binding domain-containing protein n=1 Tax=Paraburkholderia silviterrae TaxID=2528715 RepID=UPI0030B897FF